MNFATTAVARDIAPLHPDYRTLPIDQGFDWPGIIHQLGDERSPLVDPLYLVVFRSVRRNVADAKARSALDIEVAAVDAAAHEEAQQSEALLHYFAGDLDVERRAMSWCLWTSRAAARLALAGEAHQLAVELSPKFYDTFSVNFYNVTTLRPLTDTGSPFQVSLQELRIAKAAHRAAHNHFH